MLFCVTAPGLEEVLAAEVRALGVSGRAVPGGIEVADDAQLARLNLWLRAASRVLLRLGEVRATAFPELVRKASALPWERVVRPGARVAFRVTCRKSRLYHSDAVAERLLTAVQSRVRGVEPGEGQLFVCRFDRDVLTVSADASGALLHERGYRLEPGRAPLRETLAAALLLAARYEGGALCDPMCGSGTIAIEAALLARRRAPGLTRAFAFEAWPGHDARALAALRDEARAQERAQPRIEASDADADAVRIAGANAARAGVELELAVRDVAALPAAPGAGLVACNPPYGLRVEGANALRDFGGAVRTRRPGWRAALVVADARAALRDTRLALRPLLSTENGGLRVEFLAT